MSTFDARRSKSLAHNRGLRVDKLVEEMSMQALATLSRLYGRPASGARRPRLR